MAYDEVLAYRVRELLQHEAQVEERKMMGGLCFMVDGKMCAGVMKDGLLCRISPEQIPSLLENNGVSPMKFTGRTMKGFIVVDANSLSSPENLRYWIGLCLAFNPFAVASKTTKKKK